MELYELHEMVAAKMNLAQRLGAYRYVADGDFRQILTVRPFVWYRL